MKLSIIIPALNEAANIEATLRLMQAWRSTLVEVIVVDGGSTDATVELAHPLADRVIGAPRGRARQMNAGAAAASGGALWFVHADTVVPETSPEAILRAMSAGDPLPPTVSGDHVLASEAALRWGRFDVAISGSSPMLRVVAAMMNLRSRVTGVATGDQALFMTRAAFKAVGGFPDQPLMEDVEMSTRLKIHAAPVALHETVITSGRRWESRGVWRTIFLMWRLRLAYFLGAKPEELAKRY